MLGSARSAAPQLMRPPNPPSCFKSSAKANVFLELPGQLHYGWDAGRRLGERQRGGAGVSPVCPFWKGPGFFHASSSILLSVSRKRHAPETHETTSFLSCIRPTAGDRLLPLLGSGLPCWPLLGFTTHSSPFPCDREVFHI